METGTGQINKDSGNTFGWVAFLCLVFVLAVFTSSAQTQHGYVKTRGRMDSKGNPIPGERISGATVQVKGRNALVTDANGSFSFPVPANKFFVQSVTKKGYVLVDPDAIAIQYVYSLNPLIFVLESPSRLNEEKQANKRKIRSRRPANPPMPPKPVGASRDTQKASNDKIRRHQDKDRSHSNQETQRLYIKWNNYNQLIDDLAERYSQIDYDQINDLNRRISYCILNGRLTEADSLLRSKGDIKNRIIAVHQENSAIATDATELLQSQSNPDSINFGSQTVDEEIAMDCNYFYDRFILELENDSAAYYLELKVSLDSTNLERINDAGCFIADRLRNCLSNYSRASYYFDNGLRLAIADYGEQSEWAATFYHNLGIVLYNINAVIYEDNLDDEPVDLLNSLLNRSIIHLLQALAIRESLLGPDNPLTQETKEKLEFVNQQSNIWKKKQNK